MNKDQEIERLKSRLADIDKIVTQSCRDCIDVWHGDTGKYIVVQAADYIRLSFQRYISKLDSNDQIQNHTKETRMS